MSESFDNIYKEFIEFSPEERIECAKKALRKTTPYLKSKGLSNEEIIHFYIKLIGLAIGVDGRITPSETDMFNTVFGTGFDPDDLVAIISNVTAKEIYDEVNKTVDEMDPEDKSSACVVVLSVIAADGEIDRNESLLFEGIWA